MTAVFIGILVLFKCSVYAVEYNFTGDIRNFVVGNNKIYVVTDSRLHQMRHDLVEEKSKDLFNHTHSTNVTILLPFETNGSLITCGSYHSGKLFSNTANLENGNCEVLDINDITKIIYAESMRVPSVNKSSVAFLVDFDKSNEVKRGTYLLVTNHNNDNSFRGSVFLWNTMYSQKGGIFSEIPFTSSSAKVETTGDVDWVDGFQTSSYSHSYLFLNDKSAESSVTLLRMDNSDKKTKMTESLKGAKLECCDDKTRRKLVSSAVISSGNPLLWAGIFTAQEELENTVLAIFDIGNPGEHVPSNFECIPKCSNKNGDIKLRPQAVVFRQTSMTSVAAQQIGSWIVLYIGTGNGQLIKLVLDKTLRPGCAVVLYRSDDDRMLFPRMHFDPVDHKYIYIALGNQIRRVAVTQCELFITLRDCRSSSDPLCGWCMTTNKCSNQDECSDSTWISNHDSSFQKELISFHVTKGSTNSEAGIDAPFSKDKSAMKEKWTSDQFCTGGSQDIDLMGAIGKMNAGQTQSHSVQLTVTLHMSVEGTGRPSFSCIFKSGRKDLCDSLPTAVFPKCSCSFSSQDLPTEGLDVIAAVTTGDETLTESLKLKNCPDISGTSPAAKCTACVSAGCHWSSSSQTCSWYNVSTPQVHIQDTCKDLSTVTKYTPEIISLWPTRVSFHGRNNAVIKGVNLEQVVKIRFQGILDCSPKESPVLERSSDTLRFHIPSGNKGTVRVCVVTPDGSCHSNTSITYGSQPTCTGLQPSNTWASGGRQIHVLGNNLENVEVSVHSPSKKITLNSSSKSFWFHSYDKRQYQAPGPFNVFLIVANTTVHCAQPLHYHPDPEFTSFDTSVVGDDMLISIQKKEDELNLSMEELKVFGRQEDESFSCSVVELKSTTVLCKIHGGKVLSVTSLRIEFGNITKTLKITQSFIIYLCILFILILFVAIGGIIVVYHLWHEEVTQ